jgi:hypothetical protein
MKQGPLLGGVLVETVGVFFIESITLEMGVLINGACYLFTTLRSTFLLLSSRSTIWDDNDEHY